MAVAMARILYITPWPWFDGQAGRVMSAVL